ncbi:hypothetical protein HW555_001991, partial [Spodoptera exigua]
PGDEESASESEGEEHPLDIELRSPARQLVSPTAQDQDLQPNSPSVSDTQGQAQLNQPSAVGSTAEWTTTGEMREIYFTKSNEFYDFSTMICTETNAQAQRLISRHNQEVSSRRSRDFARISGWKQGKLNNGHELYMDNFYNSFGLAKKLLDHNTYCTGTLRKDLKENPQEIRKKNIKKGENISMFREGVHVGVWKDKRVVTYITTQYKDRMVPVQNKRGQVTSKPEAISKYNDYMSGADMQDQLLAYYPCERKTLRWYLKLAIHTFQLLFLNSMKMYNKYSGQRKMSLYDYRMNVINALLPENVPGNRPSNTQTHKIKKATETTSNGRLKRKTCRQCTKNKKRTDSPWYCDTCPDKPDFLRPQGTQSFIELSLMMIIFLLFMIKDGSNIDYNVTII